MHTFSFLASILPYSIAAWEKLSIFLNFKEQKDGRQHTRPLLLALHQHHRGAEPRRYTPWHSRSDSYSLCRQVTDGAADNTR
ncbi:MAG: hypothetical protein CYG59_20495 [Chloroflexi bacterium]|nr:MAG: hypothetical protein CYG59_20495 [Chloroflexota bacterium]